MSKNQQAPLVKPIAVMYMLWFNFFLVQKCFEPVQIFWTSTNFLNQFQFFEPGQNILNWYQMFQPRPICFNLS